MDHDSLDLHRFERLVSDGTELLERGRAEDAAVLLQESLALWRGPALADVADEGVLRQAAARLDELRLVALEQRILADLACGRHTELVGELEALATEYPLRERPRALQMLALYRCGRQADALAAYRVARATLVDQLGIEPGAQLQELEHAILEHDPALDLEPPRQRASASGPRVILVAALELEGAATLLRLAEPLARIGGPREIVLASTVASASELTAASSYLRTRREELTARNLSVRAAAFTSVTPGKDLSRLAAEQEAELVLVDAPDRLLEDGRLLTLLEEAPCDVAVLVDGAPGGDAVVVPFTGAEHDWSAVELGAWFALGTELPLVLAGASSGAEGGDASRLLAGASLAVQTGVWRACGAASRRADGGGARGGHARRGTRHRRAHRPLATRRDRARSRRSRRFVAPPDADRPGRAPSRRPGPALERDPLHLDGWAERLARPVRRSRLSARLAAGAGGGSIGEETPECLLDLWHDPHELERPPAPPRPIRFR